MTEERDPHLLTGAYALDALDADARAAFEAALEQSEDLRIETAELADTAVQLGLAVAPEAPPAALRGRILDAVAAAPQQAALPQDRPVVATTPGAHPAPVAHAARGRASRRWRRPALLLAAAAAAVALFAGGAITGRQFLTPAADASMALASISSATDVRVRTTAVEGGGTATVLWSPHLAKSAIVWHGTDTVPAGDVLQFWHIRGSAITSAGLYSPAGGTDYEVLAGAVRPGETIGVTVEPAGGSSQPTSKPIATVALGA